jgi:acylphosphatase
MPEPDDREASRPDDEPSRLEVVVTGRVQGVGFRYFALQAGHDLGLSGWVANEADGSVHALAEGRRDVLERFLARLDAGPPAAIVDRVRVTWGPPTGGLGPFAIRSGAHRGD